ncbi:MAG: glycosyltransferase family 2 protein [Vulcanimicrobiaceae bacterium]
MSVVVPTYNEAEHLDAHITSIDAFLVAFCDGHPYEIVVVDDGSNDGTHDVLRIVQQTCPSVAIVTHAVNRGLDDALATGFAVASGDTIVAFDADLTYAPSIIGALVDALESNHVDIAIASAYASGGSAVAVPWLRSFLSRNANRYLSLAVRGRIATLTCMVRAYRSDVLRSLYAPGVRHEATFGLLFAALKSGASVVEVPAMLDWSAQPPDRAKRLKPMRITRHIARVFQAGIKARPSLLIAIPGLVPGLLPAIVGMALLARASARTLAVVTAITLAVQYGSLLILTTQLGDYAARCRSTRATLRRT